MTAVEVLAAGGILRAAEVVELADDARLDLACAAVLLVKESGGGRNIWGHDAVATGGAYTKGGPVTRDNYAAYRAAVRAGRAGRQGVGPTQLTFGAYQDQADAAGGCWHWPANVLTGFRILAGLIRVAGERDGFRRYNGSGPAAQRYADDAMRRLDVWRARLAPHATQEAPVPTPATPAEAALADADVDRIARRIAELVWRSPVVNAFGLGVEPRQILNGIEGRVATLQAEVAALRDRLDG